MCQLTVDVNDASLQLIQFFMCLRVIVTCYMIHSHLIVAKSQYRTPAGITVINLRSAIMSPILKMSTLRAYLNWKHLNCDISSITYC